jgi:hypothetical protein
LLVKPTPRNVNLGSDRFAMFNKQRDISIVLTAYTYIRARGPPTATIALKAEV